MAPSPTDNPLILSMRRGFPAELSIRSYCIGQSGEVVTEMSGSEQNTGQFARRLASVGVYHGRALEEFGVLMTEVLGRDNFGPILREAAAATLAGEQRMHDLRVHVGAGPVTRERSNRGMRRWYGEIFAAPVIGDLNYLQRIGEQPTVARWMSAALVQSKMFGQRTRALIPSGIIAGEDLNQVPPDLVYLLRHTAVHLLLERDPSKRPFRAESTLRAATAAFGAQPAPLSGDHGVQLGFLVGVGISRENQRNALSRQQFTLRRAAAGVAWVAEFARLFGYPVILLPPFDYDTAVAAGTEQFIRTMLTGYWVGANPGRPPPRRWDELHIYFWKETLGFAWRIRADSMARFAFTGLRSASRLMRSPRG